MRSKIKLTVLCVLFVTALGCSATAIKSLGNDTHTAPPTSAVYNEPQAAYWLFDSGGYVAVYAENDESGVEITDIETQTLNDYDRELLREGIPAKDKAELLSLLEDLSS